MCADNIYEIEEELSSDTDWQKKDNWISSTEVQFLEVPSILDGDEILSITGCHTDTTILGGDNFKISEGQSCLSDVAIVTNSNVGFQSIEGDDIFSTHGDRVLSDSIMSEIEIPDSGISAMGWFKEDVNEVLNGENFLTVSIGGKNLLTNVEYLESVCISGNRSPMIGSEDVSLNTVAVSTINKTEAYSSVVTVNQELPTISPDTVGLGLSTITAGWPGREEAGINIQGTPSLLREIDFYATVDHITTLDDVILSKPNLVNAFDYGVDKAQQISELLSKTTANYRSHFDYEISHSYGSVNLRLSFIFCVDGDIRGDQNHFGHNINIHGATDVEF